MRTLLALCCSVCTCAVSGWMGIMYLSLRHAQYQARFAVAALIFLGAAMLLAGRPAGWLRPAALAWGAALAAVGLWAIISPGDDGWVLVAGSLFVAEGTLAVLTAGTGV